MCVLYLELEDGKRGQETARGMGPVGRFRSGDMIDKVMTGIQCIKKVYIQYVDKHCNQYIYKYYKSVKYVYTASDLCYRRLVARLVYSTSNRMVSR